MKKKFDDRIMYVVSKNGVENGGVELATFDREAAERCLRLCAGCVLDKVVVDLVAEKARLRSSMGPVDRLVFDV